MLLHHKEQMVEASPAWLPFLRINIALLALFHFLSVQPDFNDLYSLKAYVYPDILDAAYDHYSFTFVSLQLWLNRLHMPVSYEGLLAFCRVAYPLCLLLLLAGLFTRVSAVLSLFLQLLFIKSIHLYEYGADYFTTIALFYCCIFPVGRLWSVDNRIFKNTGREIQHLGFLYLLRAHICVIYFFSGFDKVIGETWRNGEAIWKALHSHDYYSIFSLDFLSNTPFFFIACWATMILEMAYPVFINLRHTRRFWLAGIISLHIFIAFFMGLFFFSGILIMLNLAAYYAPEISVRQSALQS